MATAIAALGFVEVAEVVVVEVAEVVVVEVAEVAATTASCSWVPSSLSSR